MGKCRSRHTTSPCRCPDLGTNCDCDCVSIKPHDRSLPTQENLRLGPHIGEPLKDGHVAPQISCASCGRRLSWPLSTRRAQHKTSCNKRIYLPDDIGPWLLLDFRSGGVQGKPASSAASVICHHHGINPNQTSSTPKRLPQLLATRPVPS